MHTRSTAPAPAPLPALPLELIHLIVTFALPPAGYEHFSTRSTYLRSLSLVSRNWTWTQSLLFEDVLLRSPRAATRLSSTVQSNARLAKTVRVLRLGAQWERLDRTGDGGLYHLGELLATCSNVRELQIGRIGGIDVEDLSKGTALESLSVWDCSVVQEREVTGLPLLLPRLRHLFLADVELNTVPSPYHLMRSDEDSPFPALTSLAIPTALRSMVYGFAMTLPTLNWLEGDLAIALSLGDTHLPDRLLLARVALLHVEVESLRPDDAFTKLPPTLRFLRVTSGHFFGSDVVTPGLKRERKRLALLEELILPLRLESASAFDELREWTKEEGVRIRYEADERGQGSVNDERFWRSVRRVEAVLTEEARLKG